MRVYVVSASKSKSDPRDYIDTTTTGTSYYDNFLNAKDLQYMEDNKNRTGHIEYMTPSEYYTECAKMFNSTVYSLKRQRLRDRDTLEYMYDQIEQGNSFDLPYINYADCGQEGLHRMLALGQSLGWDTIKFPVLVVDYVDERVDQVKAAQKELREAVRESLEYKYDKDSLPGDLLDQIQYELDKYNEFSDDETYTATIRTDGDQYIVSLEGFEDELSYTIDFDEIHLRTQEDIEEWEKSIEDDLEDTDIADLLFM